jgi:adenylate cyclase
MWNAPVDQPNHPELACRAGLAMLKRLPEVAEHWTRVLEGTLRVGVGIHTGLAQVGNVGSTRRLKYGARGTTVNLTSRVEAATKLIGLPILITGETAARLTGDLKPNRVCQAKLPGMPDSVELYAISPTIDEPTTNAWKTYHEALELFENGNLDKAQQLLEQLPEGLGSIPQKFLKREIGQLQDQKHGRRSKDRTNAKDSPVIELQTK